MSKKVLTLTILLSLFAISIPGAALAREASVAETRPTNTAQVLVVHGIPGQDLGLPSSLPVDVLVNDKICALSSVSFGEISKPLILDAGKYNIKISSASKEPCSNPAIIEVEVPFEAGENATVIAHLDAKGQPTASKFVNFQYKASITPDDKFSPQVKSLLAVRHTAYAPAVDVTATMAKNSSVKVQVKDLVNSEEGQAFVIPGTWQITIDAAQAADPDAVPTKFGGIDFSFGPETVTLEADMAYFVYAVGSAETGSFTLIIQALPLPA